MAERIKIEGFHIVVFEDGDPLTEYVSNPQALTNPIFNGNSVSFQQYNNTGTSQEKGDILGTVKKSFDLTTIINDATGTTFTDVAAAKTFIRSNTFNPSEQPIVGNFGATGWAAYADTQYPDSASAFTLSADTDTQLPNNKGTVNETQMPSDITTFYDGNVITGRNGDSLDAMMYFKSVPSVNNQWLEIWIDITAGTGIPVNLANLYRQTFTFPRGAGTERGVLYSLPSAYTLDTWEANGGIIYMRSNANLEIYTINFNFDRSHKAV